MADVTLWLPLGTAVIGAAAALAGNALSPMLGSKTEHEQWLRNKRSELVEHFYEVLHEAQRDASEIWARVTLREANPHGQPLEQSQDTLHRLTSASARAELYVSDELAKLMSTVAYDYQVVFVSVDDYEAEKWAEVYEDWSGDVGRCTELIRKELGVD